MINAPSSGALRRPADVRSDWACRSAGFTLIELMIAIALSATILLTVMAGFRVASQSITTVNRLATENQLMRLGVQVAHERLDFWTDLDNPDDVNNQFLRSKDMNGGLPFTPMNVASPYIQGSTAELSTGWNSADLWPAADPRVWWHGNVAEKCNSNLLCGRYSVFGNTSPTLIVNGGLGSYGQVTVPHSWLYNQIWSMHNALGYYGYFDYMPANTLYECYQPYNSGQTNNDGESLLLDTPGGAFASSEGPQYYPHGLYRLSMGTAIGLTVPAAFNASGSQPGANSPGLTSPAHGPSMNRSIYFQQYYYLDYQANLPTLTQFDMDTTSADTLIHDTPGHHGPANWPEVQVNVQRFIKTNRFVNVCRVICTSPLTGQVTQLVWDGCGTTLRGARLQRGRATGWATWDDVSASLSVNTPTLDDP